MPEGIYIRITRMQPAPGRPVNTASQMPLWHPRGISECQKGVNRIRTIRDEQTDAPARLAQ